ncbi:MAG: phosphodiester glycosidase family protein [Eubacteriales bacterium]|nr:phosphodiester glycosidase family protein [Eubacteriales bacterium]
MGAEGAEKKQIGRKRGAVLAACAAGVLVLAGILYFTVGRPYFGYRRALNLRTQGQYEQSAQAFAALGDYRDASAQGKESRLAQIGALCTQGEFDAAQQLRVSLALPEGEDAAQNSRIRYAQAAALLAQEKYEEAKSLFAQLGDYEDASAQADVCADGAALRDARAAMDNRDYTQAESLLAQVKDAGRAQELTGQSQAAHAQYLEEQRAAGQNLLACGAWYTMLTGQTPATCGEGMADGTQALQGKVYGGLFSALVVDAQGGTHCLGSAFGYREEIEGWKNVAQAAVGWNHILAVTGTGEVLSAGDNLQGQLDCKNWSGITAVAAGACHSVGLKSDGTAVAAGDDQQGQCQVTAWKDLSAVAAGLRHTVGLKSDGTVAAAGDNSFGQCDVSAWQGIVAIAAGGNHTLGLKADGTVVAAGDNKSSQGEVAAWRDIVAISAGMWHSAGLRADGRVVTAGCAANGQCATESFDAFGLPAYAQQMQNTLSQQDGEFCSDVTAERGPWIYVGGDLAVKVAADPVGNNKSLTSDLHLPQGSVPFNVFAEKDPNGKKTALPARVARQNQVVFGQTGDYLSYPGNPKGVMIRNGKVYYDEKKVATMAFFPDGTLRVYAPGEVTAQQLLDQGVKDSWAFGPVLVEKGKANSTLADHRLNRGNYRGAIGMIEPFHFVSVVTDGAGSPTLVALADKFVERRCVTAYNLDGGNSCGVVLMGEQLNQHAFNVERHLGQRPMPDMLALGHTQSLPDENDEYVRKLHVDVPNKK